MMANPSKFQLMTTEDSNVILTLRGVTIEHNNYVNFWVSILTKK